MRLLKIRREEGFQGSRAWHYVARDAERSWVAYGKIDCNTPVDAYGICRWLFHAEEIGKVKQVGKIITMELLEAGDSK